MATPSATPSTPRFHFVDLLRGWAVLVMIETHVVNALLLPNIKEELSFKIFTFINGLVAPSFLFCAGFAFAITLRRKWQEYISTSMSFWRYAYRLLFILVVGYSLHIPIFSLRQLKELTDASRWVPFFQVDILQTISVTLMLLLILVVVMRKEMLFLLSSMTVVLVAIFFAPIIREWDYTASPIWLRPYFTTQFKSQFPLFPWSAFLITGMLIGWWFLHSQEKGSLLSTSKRLAILSLGGVLVSLLIEYLPIDVYPNHSFWRASPEFFFVRLGIVLISLVGLWWRERSHPPTGRSYLSLFGQESLLVYVVHLLVVYGYTYELSFIRLFGPTLNYLECLGLFAVLTLAMYILAYVWHWLKGWNKRLAQITEVVVLASIVAEFILK